MGVSHKSPTMKVLVLSSLLLLSVTVTPLDGSKAAPVPVVLWHGMGDSAAGMTGIEPILKDNIEGVYVHRIMIGGNVIVDTESGFFRDTNRQVSEVCEMMAKDPELQDGYNAIGFSQGGQLLRAVAQRCPNPPMKNLVTFGAQHQGVFGFPNCPGEINFFCDIVRDLLNYGAYVDFVQDFLVQAQYWHDPLHFDTYVEKSQFIAEVNNEKLKRMPPMPSTSRALRTLFWSRTIRTVWWSPGSLPILSSTPRVRLMLSSRLGSLHSTPRTGLASRPWTRLADSCSWRLRATTWS